MLGFKLTHLSKRGTRRIRAIYSPINIRVCHCLMSVKWSGTWHIKATKHSKVGAMYILFWDILNVCRLFKPMFIYQSVKNQRTAFNDLAIKMVRVFYLACMILHPSWYKRDIFVSRKFKSFRDKLAIFFNFSSLIYSYLGTESVNACCFNSVMIVCIARSERFNKLWLEQNGRNWVDYSSKPFYFLLRKRSYFYLNLFEVCSSESNGQ